MALDEHEFEALVERLKRTESARSSLIYLLDERHPAYDQRATSTIVRMRGWVLLALAEVGVTEEELEFVLEEIDTGNEAYLVAAAACALRSYSGLGKPHQAVLERALGNIRDRDDALSLDVYGGYSDKPQFVTATGEIKKTLALIATRRPAAPACCCGGAKARETSSQPARRAPATRLQDHAGSEMGFADFFTGKPTIVAFFYTRCTNPNKCSLTITKLAELQAELGRRGLGQRIRTAAITYDAPFDDPGRLKQYMESRGARLGEDHRALRPVSDVEAMSDYFELGVSYVGTIVSRHRVELYVLDAHGRIAAQFDRLLWKEKDVIDAAIRALGDQEPPAPPPPASPKPPRQLRIVRATPAAAVASTLLSVATAFFPKCPMCWAAYLSAFGVAGLGGIEYSPWLLPVFAALMVANLYCLYPRDGSLTRRAAFGLAAAGALVILGPGLLWQMAYAPVIGVSLTIAGSLLCVGASLRQAPSQWARAG